MENQDFNKELMDYLYGELTAKERKDFELKLEKDPELKKELDVLNSVRKELDKLEDKEVMEPFSTWGRSKSKSWLGSLSRRSVIVFRPVTAVAASLLILILVGYLTNFSMSIDDRGLLLGFGNQIQTAEEKYLGKEDVKVLIQRELDRNNKMLLARLAESENSNNSKFVALETSVSKVIKTNEKEAVTNEDLQKFFKEAENENSELMRNYLKLATLQQQEYFKTMLTQFNDFMQEQRKEDLTIIRTNLMELKQSQTIQKQETDQLLAGILTSVNQKNKN